MDLYEKTSYELSRHLTERYSTSFSLSSRLFSKNIRPHIYAIYGLVRIADEIVDTYQGKGAATLLEELEKETMRAIQTGYSTNPIVQSFATTAGAFNIDAQLIRPFFASMNMDLRPQHYTQDLYKEYIYGSAEVIGLMCLRVFCNKDDKLYKRLETGARALGAAYQKVNFLRDIKSDAASLNRMYFPDVTFETFSAEQKLLIEADIENDFTAARPALEQLPRGAKSALMASYDYYYALFQKLKHTDIATLKQTRIRISDGLKLVLLARRAFIR